MTLLVKSFCVIENYANNANNATAVIGELSTYTQTFSKDVKSYQNSLDKNLLLKVFTCKETGAGSVALHLDIRNAMESVCSWVYTAREGGAGIITKVDFLNALTSQFVSSLKDVTCGAIVRTASGKYFPEWVAFSKREYVGGENALKVWFSNESFSTLYDEYSVVVVPPLANIDEFFLAPSALIAKLNAVNMKSSIDRIEVARDKYPETIISNTMLNYVNPINTNQLVPTYWTLLIYGPQGNDDDVIRKAIVDYLSNNSNHALDEWKNIIPELFGRSEFTLFPRWHKLAIPNRVVENSGIYSNTVHAPTEIAWVKAKLPGLTSAFVDAHLRFMPHHYKSLMLLVIPGDFNPSTKLDIDVMFTDVINVASTSNDFNRMSTRTQDWLTQLAQAVFTAETLTAFSDAPIGFRKVTREGITYVSFMHESIQYMVSTKASTPGY